MTTTNRVYSNNPDVPSIKTKSTIDISFTEVDATASGYSASIKTNYDGAAQIVVAGGDPTVGERGTIYYTPLYVEKINYDVWKTRINKTFEELT
jgi:hypothetical protein